MSNVKTIITFAVPAVTALLGLLWYFRRKSPSPRRYVDPPDKKVPSKTEKSTSDKSQVSNKLSTFEVSNGEAGKGSSTTNENPPSIDSLKKTDLGNHSNTKGGTEPVKTTASSVNAESTVSARGDASNVKEIPVSDLIQETVIQTTLAKQFSSDKHFQVEEEIISDESKVTETATSSLQLVEESIISPSKVANVHGAPETPSPKPEQTSTPVMSKKETDNVGTPSLSVETTKDITNNCILNDKKTENCRLDAEDLKTKENITSNDLDQNIEESASLSRSWHEDIPENMDDLIDTLNISPENGFSEQNTSSENTNTTADTLNNSLKVQNSKDQNSNLDLKQDNQSIKVPFDDQTSKTGLQVEKSENNLSDSSSNCDNLSEASNDSGKGGSVQENAGTSPPNEDRIFEFNIPSDMCGLFIGTRGKTIKMISQQSGAKIRLQNNPYTRDFQICVIEGPQNSIDTACSIIKRKFPAIKYPGMDLTPAVNPVIMPEIMQLSLPEGVSVDIVVSSIVDAGRIFVQQPTHPSYPSLDRLNTFMSQCYMQEGSVPDIPRPIEAGVICAAPMLNGWYRAQIMASHEAEGSDECDIKYVDYGGYSRVSSLILKQIRSDFMTLPFEAIECYLANITPLDNEQYFSAEAAVVLEELTQGKLLQGQVVGRAEDGIPYIHVYQITGANSALLVNREMVNRGVVRWVELME